MATDCFQMDPLQVKWTTELPSEYEFKKFITISVGGVEGNIALMFTGGYYRLSINFENATETYLKKLCPVTTCILHPTTNIPILMDSSVHLVNNIPFWQKYKAEIFGVFPEIINSNKFTINCLFRNTEPFAEKTHVSTKTTMTTAPVDLQSLSRTFSAYFQNESLSDVKLKCEGRIFFAHKLILAASSKFFAAMFSNKMVENEEGVVDITDVDPDVLQLLLQYMYLGERPDLFEDTARRLYEAADKYAVYDLRLQCSDWMVEYQTKGNCLDLLVFADKHPDENFKETVLSFVVENMFDLLRTESWSTLKDKNPLLAFSVLEKFVETAA